MAKREVYMNPLQQRIWYSAARDQRVLAARRFGKTDGVIAPRMWRVAESMPQGAGIFGGNSRKQLYTRTVPAVMSALSRFFNFTEGIHFGWGRPPKTVPNALIKPKTFDNVMWLANGYLWHLVSLAVSGSANGMTVNSLILDECKFMKLGKVQSELMPTLSGITHPFGDKRFSDENPFYKSTLFTSDAALSAKGNWLEKEEEKLDLPLDDDVFRFNSTKKYHTLREIQEELDHYADRLIYYNNMLRECKANNLQPTVVRPEEKARIQAVAQSMLRKEGPFKILPNWGQNMRKYVEMALNYKLIPQEDAELIYNYKYLLTPDEHFEFMRLCNSEKYRRYINSLRCNGFTFYRASSLDNVDLLGESYIKAMKRSLPPLVFALSILNLKTKKSGEGFYFNLDIENVHGYIPDDCPAIDAAYKKQTASGVIGGQQINREYESPDFAELQELKDCSLDGDVMPGQALHIAGDWNAHVNWFVSGQLYKRDGVEALNVLSSMFVKNERQLRALCADWNKYYTPHKKTCNTVFFYYDHTAKQKEYAVEYGRDNFYQTVCDELRKYGWNVVAIDMGHAPTHVSKHKIINECLAGVAFPAIRFNRENNEALIIAMENTEVAIGYDGFKKDKSGEKLAESHAIDSDDPAVPYELRTDGTDAFDSLFWGVKYFRYAQGGVYVPTSLRRR